MHESQGPSYSKSGVRRALFSAFSSELDYSRSCLCPPAPGLAVLVHVGLPHVDLCATRVVFSAVTAWAVEPFATVFRFASAAMVDAASMENLTVM